MHCIELTCSSAKASTALALIALLAACATPLPPDPAVVRDATPAAVSGAGTAAVTGAATASTAKPAPVLPPVAAPATAAPPPLVNARNWDEYRLRAAQTIASVNAPLMFRGPVPERLASIPVLQVHLNRDGSIRQVEVLRTPRFSPETVQLATQAIRRVGNFGPVGHLPQPWRFTETFLYNDDLKFQLHTLVQAQD